MIKVGIVVFQNLRYAPFLKVYETMLSKCNNVAYDIIYYDRDENLNEIKDNNHIGIKWYGKGTNRANKIEKALNFFVYPFQVKSVLKKNKYDFIIVLMTMPGVLLSNYLMKNYDNKYLIDIRDYTQEHIKWYFNLEKQLIDHAALRVISSEGFKNFLPSSDYKLCHNLDANAQSLYSDRTSYIKASNRKIIISYIGGISYEKQCIQLIDLVKKDDRFEFHFYGNENTSHEVSEYVKKLNIKSVRMFGPFLPNQKKDIYEKSDLVFNCYGNDSTLVKYAISNKHYDGALYRRPLIVSPNTTMCDLAGDFGYALDLDNIKNLDGLYDWYEKLNEKDYEQYADKIIKQSLSDNSQTEKAIIDVIFDANN